MAEDARESSKVPKAADQLCLLDICMVGGCCRGRSFKG